MNTISCVVVVDGPHAGQWFLRADWEQRRRAHQRMIEAHQVQSVSALDYQETGQTMANPAEPKLVGLIVRFRPRQRKEAQEP